MAAKYFVAVCAFALFSAVHSQVLNRVIPGFAPNLLPLAETLLPNQVYINPSVYPGLVNYDLPYGFDILSAPVQLPTVVSAPVSPVQLPTVVSPTTTIIQDSTVANNLAQALQLLVVSNLLSNTLPLGSPDVIVPNYGPVGLPGCSYIY